MDWTEVPKNNWDEIVQTFNVLDWGRPSAPVFMYRGQSKANWILEDTLSRILRSKVRPNFGLDIEQKLLSSFRAQAHLFLEPSLLPKAKSLLAWWSLMQHFRAPTRLLDWTASPYIALYFAVVDDWDVPGAVWLFNPFQITDACENDEVLMAYALFQQSDETRDFFWAHFSPQFVYPFVVQKHHMRISTQQGRFTVCGQIPSDHGREIEKASGDAESSHCQKLVISEELKPIFLMYLQRMNITASSLFRGLDGLGKSIEELARLDVEYESTVGFRRQRI